MIPFNARTTDLLSWLGVVKRQGLLLFFSGGAVMGVLGVLAPPMGGADPLWGQWLLLLALLLSLPGVFLCVFRAAQVQAGRFDPLFLLLGNVCVLVAMLGEVLRFDSQWSQMVILWPMVLVAGVMSRRWLWPQVMVSLFTSTLTAYAAFLWMKAGQLWFLKIIMVGMPVVFMGLVIALFRHLAVAEAQELRRVSLTDPLTELLNRRALFSAFPDWLGRVPAGAQPALVMLDLDHFKTVNDRFGHEVGDRVLKSFAATMRQEAHPADLLVRMGGEEFVWLTSETSIPALLARVDRLRVRTAEALEAQGVTVSAGVAHGTGDLSALLGQADKALYTAKNGGRNRITLFDAA